MDVGQAMKNEYVVGTFESRILRKDEVKFRNKHRARITKGNYPIWDERRMECYVERKKLSEFLRHLHLARTFMSGRDYLSAENQVREGNKPDITYIRDILRDFGVEVQPQYIKEWVNNYV